MAQNRRSILHRLVLLNALSLGVVTLGLVGYGLFAANSTQKEVQAELLPLVQRAAERQMQTLALQTTQTLREVFIQADSQAASLVQATLQAKSQGDPQLRLRLNEQVKTQVAAVTTTMGAYIALEPNVLDQKDAEFLKNDPAGSNETGRFAPWWTRSDSGELSYTFSPEATITDATLQEGQPTNWWYECPHQTGKTCVTNPYVDTSTHVLLASVVRPVNQGGAFLGIAGADIKLNFLQTLIEKANSGIYEGKGRTLLLSASGVISAHSADAASNGKNAREALGPWFERVQSAMSSGTQEVAIDDEAELVHAIFPFPLLGGSATWAIYMELPKAEVLAEAEAVNAILAQERNSTVIGQIIVGGLILVAALALALPVLRKVVNPIRQVAGVVQDIAEGDGDLTARLPELSRDELGELARNMNVFIGKLQHLLIQIKESGDRVSGAADTTATISRRNSDGIARQQHEIDQVATAVNEMAAAVQEIAGAANRAAGGASSASQSALNGRQIVIAAAEEVRILARDIAEAGAVIGRLQNESDKIVAILTVIRGIADQTNLLALNAAIEAARAGEQGRGFAVVADEVRTLAKRTQDSTVEIQRMVDSILKGTGEAVGAMDRGKRRVEESVSLSQEAEQALVSITDAVGQISDMNAQIATAVEEQTAVTEEVSRNITTIGQVAYELASAASEASVASDEMALQSRHLNGLVGQFKV